MDPRYQGYLGDRDYLITRAGILILFLAAFLVLGGPTTGATVHPSMVDIEGSVLPAPCEEFFSSGGQLTRVGLKDPLLSAARVDRFPVSNITCLDHVDRTQAHVRAVLVEFADARGTVSSELIVHPNDATLQWDRYLWETYVDQDVTIQSSSARSERVAVLFKDHPASPGIRSSQEEFNDGIPLSDLLEQFLFS